MIRYVGLDVHRKTIQACILAASGETCAELEIATTHEAILAFASRYLTAEDHLALEATGNCWAVAHLLRPLVGELVISNPLKTRAIAEAHIKTDKVDARVLADLLRCNYLPRVWTPDEPTAHLRTFTGRRAALVSQRTRLKNRIHSIFAKRLVLIPFNDLFCKEGRRWLDQQPLEPEERLLLESDLRLLQALEQEIAALEQRLAERAFDDPRVRLLMTLPGIDYTVALTVLAALGDIQRFTDGDHAAAYLGLVPSTRQSGSHCYHGPITKRGNRRARWMLIQAAQHFRCNPGPLGVFYRRLRNKKNHSVAVVASARKLVTIAHLMLKHGEPYRYAQPLLTQDKLARLRIKVTKKRRKTGPKPGSPPAPNQGTGTRTRLLPSLAHAYAAEDLPSPTPYGELPPGERRALREMGLVEYASELDRDRRVTRRGKKPGPEAVAAAACIIEPTANP